MSNRTQLHDLTVCILEHASPIRTPQLRLLKAVAGMQVVGAGTDAQADLPTLEALRPDVVLVGLRTGQTLRHVRLLTVKLPTSTLIVLSNSGSSLMRKACLRAGGNHCFDKTQEVDELRTAMLEVSGAAQRSSDHRSTGLSEPADVLLIAPPSGDNDVRNQRFALGRPRAARYQRHP